jgi:molybdopterin adenylyltransferase
MQKEAKVISVNISEKKGTIKVPVDKITLTGHGIINDAHAGNWHRQVSLLAQESIEKFGALAARSIDCGEFAENITTQGIILYKTNPLDRLIIGDVELEITQIGKKCHGDNCAIYREVGNCVMPKEGIFCRVIKSGEIRAGNDIIYKPKEFYIRVITLSDRASSGEYEDRSGPRLVSLLREKFDVLGWKCNISLEVIPDDASFLSEIMIKAKNDGTDFLFTTGGTGIGPRDITPEVVQKYIDKEIPGIMEMIRMKFGMNKPAVLLSRSVAAVMGNTLVFTLPGSVKAVEEYMSEIGGHIKHLVSMLHGIDEH